MTHRGEMKLYEGLLSPFVVRVVLAARAKAVNSAGVRSKSGGEAALTGEKPRAFAVCAGRGAG